MRARSPDRSLPPVFPDEEAERKVQIAPLQLGNILLRIDVVWTHRREAQSRVFSLHTERHLQEVSHLRLSHNPERYSHHHSVPLLQSGNHLRLGGLISPDLLPHFAWQSSLNVRSSAAERSHRTRLVMPSPQRRRRAVDLASTFLSLRRATHS